MPELWGPVPRAALVPTTLLLVLEVLDTGTDICCLIAFRGHLSRLLNVDTNDKRVYCLRINEQPIENA